MVKVYVMENVELESGKRKSSSRLRWMEKKWKQRWVQGGLWCALVEGKKKSRDHAHYWMPICTPTILSLYYRCGLLCENRQTTVVPVGHPTETIVIDAIILLASIDRGIGKCCLAFPRSYWAWDITISVGTGITWWLIIKPKSTCRERSHHHCLISGGISTIQCAWLQK